jgi:hypothetical protein
MSPEQIEELVIGVIEELKVQFNQCTPEWAEDTLDWGVYQLIENSYPSAAFSLIDCFRAMKNSYLNGNEI